LSKKIDIDVKKLIEELSELQISGEYYFRGTNSTKQMNSTLYRKYKENEIEENKIDINQYEIELLTSYGQYEGTFVRNFNSVTDWIASAQHYGLPTRFIDWTRNPFYALFFSLYYKGDAQDYRVWVVNSKKIRYFDAIPNIECNYSPLYRKDYSNMMLNYFKNLRNTFEDIETYNGKFTQEGEAMSSFYKKMKEIKNAHIFFGTNYSNLRLVAQQGLFQWGSNQEFDENKVEYIEKVYCIKPEEREKILLILDNMGINIPRLFPELESICQYLGQKKYSIINQ